MKLAPDFLIKHQSEDRNLIKIPSFMSPQMAPETWFCAKNHQTAQKAKKVIIFEFGIAGNGCQRALIHGLLSIRWTDDHQRLGAGSY